jgi:diguanylate cyclase (GGDEF)-like protein
MLFVLRHSVLVAVAAAIAGGAAAVAAAAAPSVLANERLEAARLQEADGQVRAAADTLVDLLATADDLDPASRATIGAHIARLFLTLGDFATAMEAATTAAADAELADDRSAQAYAEFMVGMVHRNLNQFEAAKNAFRASARLALDAGDTEQYLRATNEESNALVRGDDLEGALEKKLEALRAAGEGTDPAIIASLENDIAFVYSLLDRHAEAFPHFERAWELNLELDHRRDAAIIACNLAGNLAALGDFDRAMEWAERGLAIADVDDLLPVQELAHATLGALLSETGDAAQAVPHLQEAYDLRGRTLNEDSARRIAELGSRHEAERREAEIALLRRDADIRELELDHARTLRRLLVGGMAALVAFLAVLAAAYRIKARANAEISAANRNLETARRRVEELSRTDALTGLANRRALEERLAAEARRSERSRRGFAVVLADIDRFKDVNDSFGHDPGDEVLRELAKRLRAGVRAVDLAGRWGGDEFLVILPDTDADGGRELAEKLRQAIGGRPVTVSVGAIPVTVTFGVAVHHHGSFEETIRRADEALYRGKRAGRDRVAVG